MTNLDNSQEAALKLLVDVFEFVEHNTILNKGRFYIVMLNSAKELSSVDGVNAQRVLNVFSFFQGKESDDILELKDRLMLHSFFFDCYENSIIQNLQNEATALLNTFFAKQPSEVEKTNLVNMLSGILAGKTKDIDCLVEVKAFKEKNAVMV